MSGSSLDSQPLLVLVGPTASGKSDLALHLATSWDLEIVSLDSMLVYRGMDIGTAKPSRGELAAVPHHMIDIASPAERFDIQRFLKEAEEALADIQARGKRALFVGGTGFYLAALLRGLFEGPPVDEALRARLEAHAQEVGPKALHAELARLDPASAERLHPGDVRRVIRGLEIYEQSGRTLSSWQTQWNAEEKPRLSQARLLGLHLDTPQLDARIAARTGKMLDDGWREEASRLRENPGLGPSAIQALGYRTVLAWADGEIERSEAQSTIALRTRQFARRQRTWYRKFDIHWLPADGTDLSSAAAQQLLL